MLLLDIDNYRTNIKTITLFTSLSLNIIIKIVVILIIFFNVAEPMSVNNPVGINITAIFVSENTGLILKDNYLYDPDER